MFLVRTFCLVREFTHGSELHCNCILSGGRGNAGGQHHHRILMDKYHPGYFGKVKYIYTTHCLST